MKKSSLVLIAFFLAIGAALAQRTVRGTVTDVNGDGLIGANVLVKGTTVGTVTEVDGSYTLEIPAGSSVLVFSYTGFETQEVQMGVDDVINVTLAEGITLSEAVVTALGTPRSSKSLPYAAQQLSGEKLNAIPNNTVNNALSGKIAGVQVRGQSYMALGRDASIRIRGAGSLTDKEPLYVVDGTPTSGIDINPEDIESMTVLKGPSATALYGQRGDAGVIVIKTKKGVKGKGIGLEVNQGTFWDKVYILPHYQNSYAGGGAADLIQFAWEEGMPEEWKTFEGKYHHDYSDDASWGPRMVGQEYIPWYSWYVGTPDFGKTEKLLPQPNNIRDFYNTGVTLNNNINLSQAGNGYSIRLSYTNQNIKGLLPNSGLNKHLLNANANFDLGKYVSAGANINVINQKLNGEFDDGYANQSSGSFNQWFHRHLDINKMRSLSGTKSPQGILASWNHNNPGNYLSSPLSFYGGNYWYNFYDYFDNLDQVENRDRIYGDVHVTFKPFKNFDITGYVRRNDRKSFFENKGNSVLETSATQTGFRAFYGTGFDNQREDNYEVLASYTNRFGALSLEARAGGNIRVDTRNIYTGNTVNGLNIPDLFTLSNSKTSPFGNSNFRSKKEVRSLYGIASFGFKDLLYLDMTARNDWSSALPVNANSYFYPSVGLSFVFSELLNIDFISFGKVRGSWARVGSDLDAYQLALNYGVGANQWNGNILMGTPNELVDPAIEPSLSSAYEFGGDIKFFTNRLGFSVTYYNENKINEILSVPVSGASGFGTKKINAGQVDRNGVEVSVQIIPVQTSNFNWDITLNFAKNNSKVIELAEGIDAIIQETGTFGTSFGARLVHRVGEQWGQIRGGGIKRNDSGVPMLTNDGQFIAVPDTYFGTVLPDFTGGLVNEISFKNLFVNLNLDYSKGGKFFSLSDSWGKFSGLFDETGGLNDKGNPVRDPVAVGGGVHVEGVNNETGAPMDLYVDAFSYFHQFVNKNISEPSVLDLDYVKLREVSVGYQLPVKKIGLDFLQAASISLTARNPWLIYSKSKDFDPSELGQRFGENGQFPGTRSFGFNIKLGF